MKRWSLPVLMLFLGLAIGSTLVSTWLHGQNPPPMQPPAALPRELTSYRDVVKRVLPAVVSIDTRAKTKAANPGLNPPIDPNMPNDPRRNPFDPGEPGPLGFGSGFFVDPAGVVVTNYHVVEGAETATIHLLDGRKFTSKNIRVDRRTDVAVIILDVKDGKFPVLEFGDSDAMEIGDRVLAVGAPFGLTGSVTHGIISGKGRNGLHMNLYEDFLQTDAAINPGNSGGPLVNLEGKVVGLNAAIKSKTGGFQGVGLAVASNLAKNAAESLRTKGAVQRGYLGVQVRELAPEVGARLGLPKDTAGVVVAQVFDNTPAAKAGLKVGDILTSIADKAIKDGKAVQYTVAVLPVGKAANVVIYRDGKMQTLPVTIEEQPTEYGSAGVPAPRNLFPPPASVVLDLLGVDVAEVNDEIAESLGFRKGTQGVLITGVKENSLASEAALRRGMLITKIDDQPITSTATAQKAEQAASANRGILLQIATPQGGVNYVVLRSASASP